MTLFSGQCQHLQPSQIALSNVFFRASRTKRSRHPGRRRWPHYREPTAPPTRGTRHERSANQGIKARTRSLRPRHRRERRAQPAPAPLKTGPQPLAPGLIVDSGLTLAGPLSCSSAATTGGQSGQEYRPSVPSQRHPASHSGSHCTSGGLGTAVSHALRAIICAANAPVLLTRGSVRQPQPPTRTC